MRLALLLLAVLAACVLPTHARVAGVDPAFTDDEAREIARAADDWNEHLLPERRIVLGVWPWFFTRANLHGPAGWCSRDSRIITLDDGLALEHVRQVARHEMGHALGLRDLRRGWMQKATEKTQGWSDEDQDECRRAGACA